MYMYIQKQQKSLSVSVFSMYVIKTITVTDD